jgi:hypothetical protein
MKKTIHEYFHDLHVKIGYCLYSASVSLKDVGERVRFSPLISIGKAGRKLAMKFPAK